MTKTDIIIFPNNANRTKTPPTKAEPKIFRAVNFMWKKALTLTLSVCYHNNDYIFRNGE